MNKLLSQSESQPVSTGEASSAPSTRSGIGFRVAEQFALRYSMVLVLVAVSLLAWVNYPRFFEYDNIRIVFAQNAPVGMIALAMTFVIICGGFDLSVGGVVVLSSVLYAGLSNDMSLPLAFALTLGAGLGVGLFNAFAITLLKVNAFVATLATSSLVVAVALIYSNSGPVLSDNARFGEFGTSRLLGFPTVGVVLIMTFLVGVLVLSRTVYGRSVYAVGGSYEASRLVGIRVDAVRGSTYLLTGGASALAGMMLASQTGVGQPQVVGDFTLGSIAIVIIGGTSILGGEGALWRTAIGLLIIAILRNLFDSMAWGTDVRMLVEGSIVLLAVALDSYARRRRL